jgi:hypothetical protein
VFDRHSAFDGCRRQPVELGAQTRQGIQRIDLLSNGAELASQCERQLPQMRYRTINFLFLEQDGSNADDAYCRGRSPRRRR